MTKNCKNCNFYKIYFRENKDNLWLSAHRIFQRDKINLNTTRLMVHNQQKEGQLFDLVEIYEGLYEIYYEDNDYGMKGWKLTTYGERQEEIPVFTSDKASLWKVIQYDIEKKMYKIKEALSGKYLSANFNDTRDEFSFYIELTSDESKATIFADSVRELEPEEPAEDEEEEV